MTIPKSAVDVFVQIEQHSQQNKDDSKQIVEHLLPGEFAAQGDINIWRLESIPSDAVEVPVQAQLASGSTMGSRHCIKQSDLNKVKQYRLPNPNELQGPILELSGPITIEHPEHGDQVHHSKILFISYQRKFADDLRRIAD